MGGPDRLPMFLQAFSRFLDRLQPDDRVALVVYAGDSALLLPSTAAQDKQAILAGFSRLAAVATGRPGASLQIAYDIARANFVRDASGNPGLNRVIAVSDGDLNLGVGEAGGLYDYVSRHTQDGITLSVLGVGREFVLGEKARKLVRTGKGRASATHSVSAIELALDREVAAPPAASLRDLKLELALAPGGTYRLLGFQNGLPRAGSGLPTQPGQGVVAVFELGGAAGGSAAPAEMKLHYHRALPPGSPDETLTRVAGQESASPPAAARTFDEEIAGWEARLAQIPKGSAPSAPAPAAPAPTPSPEAAATEGAEVNPNAVREFQKNAAGWIEPPPPKAGTN